MKTLKANKLTLAALLLASTLLDSIGQTRIPDAYSAPAGAVDTTKRGFKVRMTQIEITRFPGDANSVENAERQLANGYIDDATGQPYSNIADLTTAGPDGFFIDPDIINWNQDAPAAVGNFA